VSIKTVSRVTNSEPNVRPELRARVQDAIRDLNYHPSLAARSLAGRRSGLLALVYDAPSPGHLLKLQAGARAVCRERGYRLLFHPCDSRGPRLAQELLALMDHPGVEGAILAPPLSEQPELLDRLLAGALPFSLVGVPQPAPAAAWVDDEAAAVTATAHLLGLGHRRVAFIAGDPEQAATAARRRGYELALRDAGIGTEPGLIESGESSFVSGRAAARRLLSQARRPTAILASTDDLAAGVMAEAHARGLALPRELSVVGFDGTPLAALLWPPLTTMHQPVDAMAAFATHLLLDRLAGVAAARVADYGYRLVVRASAAPPG
jgi:LacI family transcriptional regulator